MGITQARKQANEKYHQKFRRLQIRVTPEEDEIIQEHSKLKNESVNSFVKRAIFEAIQRDTQGKE